MDARRVFVLKELINFHESEVRSHGYNIKLLKQELVSICSHPKELMSYTTRMEAGFDLEISICGICDLTRQVELY